MTFTEELRQKIDAGLDITREEALALVNDLISRLNPASLAACIMASRSSIIRSSHCWLPLMVARVKS